MEEKNSLVPERNRSGQEPAETLQDIRNIMERSSRFFSLSGLSGVAAGACALAGSWIARQWLDQYYQEYYQGGDFSAPEFQRLKINLLLLALAVFATSLGTAFYFTRRKARNNKLPVWDHTSRRLIINLMIPVLAGALFILAMLQQEEWKYVAPASLIFYGLALVNAGKYTLTDIRYLGVLEIILGLINTQFIGYGLYFWAAGFGGLHILYGILMWWKYEKD